MKKVINKGKKWQFFVFIETFFKKICNFATIKQTRFQQPMKTFKNHFAILLFAMMAVLSFTACEWDDSPEPDHPLYVTYTISATPSTFAGPDELAADIQAWIKANQKVYDVEVNYSTGDASEFATTDAQAVKRYDEFKSLLSTYSVHQVHKGCWSISQPKGYN